MSGNPPVAHSISAEGLVLDIALIETDRLLLHEETIPSSLERLRSTIERDGILKAPVIVDRESLVVLDGMHRVEALRSLGCRLTCACLVDYEDPRITLDRWCRVLRRPVGLEEFREKARELGASIATPSQGDEACCGVSLMLGGGSYKLLPPEPGVLSTFEMMADIDAWLMERGVDVQYETERGAVERLDRGSASSVVCPPKIGKRHVIETAEAGRVLTYKATRHIVPARPLGVDVPLDLLKDRAIGVDEANRRLSEHLEAKSLRRVPPGRICWGRRYDETLYIFEDR